MNDAVIKLINETGALLLERRKHHNPKFLRGYKTALDDLAVEIPKNYSRQNKTEFRRLYEKSGLTKAALAKLIGASESAVMAWLKPVTSKSATAVPSWAVEKLAGHVEN